MAPDFGVLTVMAEIGVAFVAFSTIVAALQPIRGKKFTRFQILLVHFYVETGLLNVALSMLPIVLWQFYEDGPTVWRISIMTILFVTSAYLASYVVRRRRVRAPTPLPSLLVMIGYFFAAIIMALSLMETLWQPSLAIISGYLLWAIVSSAIIFIYFFTSFIRRSAGRLKG